MRNLKLVSFVLLSSSCALNWSLRSELKEARRIYIAPFENMSLKTQRSHEYFKALKKKLLSVEGIQLVSRESEADEILLGRLLKSHVKYGPSSLTGDASSASSGGLAEEAFTAASHVLQVHLQLSSWNPKTGKKNWTHAFSKSVPFDSVSRFLEREASTSLPFLNESREKMLHQVLAQNFARKALDPILEEF